MINYCKRNVDCTELVFLKLSNGFKEVTKALESNSKNLVEAQSCLHTDILALKPKRQWTKHATGGENKNK